MTTPDLVDIESVIATIAAVDVATLDDAGLQRLTAVGRRLERVTASLLVRVAQRSKQLSAAGGTVDPVQAMLGRGEVSNHRARTDAARAEIVGNLPELGEALRRGQTSGEHLDAVARATTDLSETEQEGLAILGSELTEAATRLPVDTFNRHVRAEVDRLRGDGGLVRHERMRADSEFRHWVDRDGMGHFRGRLDPERHEILVGAVDGHMRTMATTTGNAIRDMANQDRADNGATSGSVRLDANLAATALVDLISNAGAGGSAGVGRSHIDLVVDAQTLQHGRHQRSVIQTSAGNDIPLETAQRHACDSVITAVVTDSRYREINVGRKYRTATDAQWSALRALYTSCGWPGCDRPISWCQAHHILFWEHDGLTDLDNLIPPCSHHHHQAHEGRWGLDLNDKRLLRVYRPDGTFWQSSTPDRLDQLLQHAPAKPSRPAPQARAAERARPPKNARPADQARPAKQARPPERARGPDRRPSADSWP